MKRCSRLHHNRLTQKSPSGTHTHTHNMAHTVSCKHDAYRHWPAYWFSVRTRGQTAAASYPTSKQRLTSLFLRPNLQISHVFVIPCRVFIIIIDYFFFFSSHFFAWQADLSESTSYSATSSGTLNCVDVSWPLTVSVTSVSPTPIRGTMALHTYWPASAWLTDFRYSWLLLLRTCGGVNKEDTNINKANLLNSRRG